MSEEQKNATESDQAADSGLNESPTLEAKLEAKMAEIKGETVQDDATPKVNDGDTTPKNEGSETKDVDSETKDEDAPLLPSGHRRAAIARGYTSEEVDHYLETKPEEATVRFEKIYTEWQDENSRYSARGRQLREVDQKANKSDGGKSKEKEAPKPIAPLDTKALIEEFGQEEMINALVGPVNAMAERLNAVAEKLADSEDFLRKTEIDALGDITQEFLTSKSMQPFEETYGTVGKLTEEQTANRMKLFEQADIIAVGAQDHGVNITVREALERAHMITSYGSIDEITRQGIRDSMKKRTKTTRGSHKQTSVTDSGDVISDDEMVKRTEARQRAIRNK